MSKTELKLYTDGSTVRIQLPGPLFTASRLSLVSNWRTSAITNQRLPCAKAVFIPLNRPIGAVLCGQVRHQSRMWMWAACYRSTLCSHPPSPLSNGGYPFLRAALSFSVQLVKAMCTKVGKENTCLPLCFIRMRVSSWAHYNYFPHFSHRMSFMSHCFFSLLHGGAFLCGS